MAMPMSYQTPGVYIEEVDRGSKPIQAAGTSVAAFLGATELCPKDEEGNMMLGRPFMVTSWTQYTEQFGGFVDGAVLPLAVYGYFLNGGGICYVESLVAAEAAAAKSNGAPAKPTLQLTGRGAGNLPALEVTAQAPGAVTVTVADATDAGDELFKLVVRGPSGTEETFDNVTFSKAKDARNVVQVVNRESKLVKLREIDSTAPLAERRPVSNTYTMPAPRPDTTTSISTKAVKGSLEDRVGIAGLAAIDEITIVAMPDLVAWHRAGRLSLEDLKGLQLELIAHCELMKDRFVILDSPADMKAQRVLDWRMNDAGYDSKYAALYYPWIWVQNPTGNGQLKVPPSGHVAGVYARVDQERGVHKAPANEILRGVLSLELQVTHGEQGLLNVKGVNCIRSFPGRGIRVWGARTLSSDMSWNYINVRRLFCMVEESIYEGTQWVVFEPNDMDLWERVKRTITAFLTRVWRDGALFGSTPEEAFYVKCDAELNPPEVRDAGQLVVEIGLAPVKPAEFVIFRFSQMSGVAE
jgi:phage tail sheath protein FI